MNQNTIVEDLRAQIEARHCEALKALDILATYLAKCQVAAPQEAVQDVVGNNGDKAANRRPGTYRERVMQVLTERWMTVQEIADASGIEAEKARGVLYAPTRDQAGIEAGKIGRNAAFRRRQVTMKQPTPDNRGGLDT